MFCLCLFFFFSSRRRHTRCGRDWSSDVCSSDLGDVFVLDMGEPVKIVELAEKMISLTGSSLRSAKNPKGEIAIEFTGLRDRKSTRLNSSHVRISYAVFCLKKKKKKIKISY